MNAQPITATKVFAFTVCLCASCAFASPLPQTKKRSQSDADINAIGHRHIDRDENFYSLDKEKRLRAVLAGEVERSSGLLNDPAVTEYIDKVAQNVAKNSDARLPIVVRVIDSDVANSFTLPVDTNTSIVGSCSVWKMRQSWRARWLAVLLTRRYVPRRKRLRRVN
jgi:predicted Zn-dependent protease